MQNRQSPRWVSRLFLAFSVISSFLFFITILLFLTPKINTLFDESLEKTNQLSANIFATQLEGYISDRVFATKDIANHDVISNSLLSNRVGFDLKQYIKQSRTLGDNTQLIIIDALGDVFYQETQGNSANLDFALPLLNIKKSKLLKIDSVNQQFFIAVPIEYGKSREGILINIINAAPSTIFRDLDSLTSKRFKITFGTEANSISSTDTSLTDSSVTVTKLRQFPITLHYYSSQQESLAQRNQLILSFALVVAVSVGLLFLLLWLLGRKLFIAPYKALSSTQDAISKALEGISVIGLDGCYKEVNSAYAELTGYQSHELIGTHWTKTVHPDDVDALQSVYQAMVVSGSAQSPARGVKKNGDTFYKQVALIAKKDRAGKLIGHFCFMQDITQRTEYENELNEAKQFQELIMRSIPDIMFVKDSEFKIIMANQGFKDLYPPEMAHKIIGRTTLEAFDEKEAYDFLEMDRLAFREGFSETVENIMMPNGRRRILRTRKIRFESLKGEPYILGLSTDVTDRERESRLMSEMHHVGLMNTLSLEAKILRILELAREYLDLSMGIVSKIEDERYTIQYITHTDNSLNMPKTFDLGDTFCSITLNSDDVMAWDNIKESKVSTHPCYKSTGLEAYIGTVLHVDNKLYGTVNFTSSEHRKSPFTDREKGFTRLVAQWISHQLSVEQNLLQKEEMIKKLTHSNEELERFAYICSHDMQEPLRMVSSFSELLKDYLEENYQDDKTAPQYLDFLIEGSKRAKTLVKDVLDYSKLDQSTDNHELVNIDILVNGIIESVNFDLDRDDVTFEKDSLPTIVGRKTQLYQLFQNLINNGIKYQEKGNSPHIVIKVCDQQTHWQFTICDNGIGIDPKHQHKIFDVFQRLHRRQHYSGTGIGLSICKKVVEQHEGTLSVSSELGKGSCFIFTLAKQ